MPFDLALSEHGDLIFSGSRDLQGVGGEALIEQRIRLRLRMIRGGWIYDPDGQLGSRLHNLTLIEPTDVTARVGMYVREALRGMDDITVDDVQFEIVDNAVEISVFYRPTADAVDFTAAELNDQSVLTLTVLVAD